MTLKPHAKQQELRYNRIIMIPMIGRILPSALALLGVVDTLKLWPTHIFWSIVTGIITIYLLHLVFKDFESSTPKHSLHFFLSHLFAMLYVLFVAYLIFF